jgi:uncharacterized cupredoxin-like copper-binding protein
MKINRLVGIGILIFIFSATAYPVYAEEEIKRVTVRLSEYRFEPSQIELSVGEATELVLINEGKTMHEFIVDALHNLTVDVEVQGVIVGTFGVAEVEVPVGGRAVLRFTPEQSGEFPIVCRARQPKDHFEQGMYGRLVIK